MNEIKFKAKVQQMGLNNDGRPRFFIYITKAVELLELTKGQKVNYSIIGIEKTEFEDSSKKIPKNTPLNISQKPEVIGIEIEPEEAEFLVKYKDSKKVGSPIAEFIYKSGVKQFGEKRVGELLKTLEVKQ